MPPKLFQTPGHFQSVPPGVAPNLLAFFPDPESFLPNTMDVYNGNGVVPPTLAKRIAAVPIYLTGVWIEGHRTKATAKDGYTHLILADPNLVLYDNYNYQGRTSAADTLCLPSGQTQNSWFVVFQFVSVVPGFGRRLVLAADRFGVPGSWTTLI